MRIDEDIVRAAETQMKRKAPSLHNPDDDDDDYHRDNSTTTNTNPSCSPSSSSLVYTKFFHSQYSYPTEKRFVSTNNVKGFAISSIMHREQSAMKEAVRLLFDYTFGVVPNGFEFAPMKVPCKAFAFIACVRPILETENDDDAKNANEVLLNMASNAINNRDKVKIRFLERIYAIMTTCENDEMEIENAIRRVRGQARTLRDALESRIGERIEDIKTFGCVNEQISNRRGWKNSTRKVTRKKVQKRCCRIW